MNLITDAWLPVVREQGADKIAPWQIVETDNPVLELAAPRPDFQGALYQFLIGLVQTCFAPEDYDEWLDYWDAMPATDVLKKRFEEVAAAFELNCSDGPAFMQDYDLGDKIKNEKIASLLIEFPGNKTINDNADFFIKGGLVNKLCPSCSAAALFCLQLNAPSGGNGHRVGVRGGGPLTTLIRPRTSFNMWKKVWINIIEKGAIRSCSDKTSSSIFPWMGPSRLSTQKKENKQKIYIDGGVPTTPEDVDLLQAYWGMPRRTRLQFFDRAKGHCDLCGCESDYFSETYQTGTWGADYVGAWVHPLTPYRFDPKKEKPPLSLKGQQGGLGYQHWLGVTMTDQASGDCAAKIVQAYMEQRVHDLPEEHNARLWCFGYDMDNMKARCWYDHEMPLLKLDKKQSENLLLWVKEMVDAASFVAGLLRSQLKDAWFKRAKDVKGDMNSIVMEFWQQSEGRFYSLLKQLADLPGDQRQASPQIYQFWEETIRTLAFDLFDTWALESPTEDADMKRIIKARNELKKQLNTNKAMKTLRDKSSNGKEEK